MGEIKKIPKEIRVSFNLANESDKELYEKLIKFTQPGKIIKKIVSENIDNDMAQTKSSSVDTELLKVLNKLSDKIDNLTVTQSVETRNESETTKELVLTADVSVDDLDDLDI